MTADAIALGTPERLLGADQIAEFFDGAAAAAFSVFIGDRPGAAWIHRGEPKVVFDFTFNGAGSKSCSSPPTAGTRKPVRRRPDTARESRPGDDGLA